MRWRHARRCDLPRPAWSRSNMAMKTQAKKGNNTEEEQLQSDHIEIHRDSLELAMLDAQANLSSAKRTLATILSFPPEAGQIARTARLSA